MFAAACYFLFMILRDQPLMLIELHEVKVQILNTVLFEYIVLSDHARQILGSRLAQRLLQCLRLSVEDARWTTPRRQ